MRSTLRTSEMPRYTTFYDARSTVDTEVHLHMCHTVALSMMPDADQDDFLHSLTPYEIMKQVWVKRLDKHPA